LSSANSSKYIEGQRGHHIPNRAMNNPFYSSEHHPPNQVNPLAPPYSRHPPVDNPRLLGPQQYSEGVSFWHTDEVSSMPVGADPSSLRERGAHATAKHRRTRSGCYTCRARRVKCDEKKPVCDRKFFCTPKFWRNLTTLPSRMLKGW